MKVKIGMYAPSKEALKATGTDGLILKDLKSKEKRRKTHSILPGTACGFEYGWNWCTQLEEFRTACQEFSFLQHAVA